MNEKDYLGKRGEILFPYFMTKPCGKPKGYFSTEFLGDKHETIDFLVRLVDASTAAPLFFVSVRATRTGYLGLGKNRRLQVKVSKEDVQKLRQMPGPAFVVGIDALKETGYLFAIDEASSKGFSSISTKHPLNCRTVAKIWNYVDDYWKVRPMLPSNTPFR